MFGFARVKSACESASIIYSGEAAGLCDGVIVFVGVIEGLIVEDMDDDGDIDGLVEVEGVFDGVTDDVCETEGDTEIDILVLRLTLADVLGEEVRVLDGEELAVWLGDIEGEGDTEGLFVSDDEEDDVTEGELEGLSLVEGLTEGDVLEEGLSEGDIEDEGDKEGLVEVDGVIEGLVEVEGVGEVDGGIIEQQDGNSSEAQATSSSVRVDALTITQFSPK